MSDLDLWAAVKTDDEQAFNALFKRYWVKLYHTAYGLLKDREAAEEVVHDVFLNLWDRRRGLEISLFPNFMLSAVRYQIYNRMRAARAPLLYQAEELLQAGLSEPNRGESRIEEEELYQLMYNYLSDLPKRCQEIFCMSRMDQLSNEEIASRLGISRRTVENQLTTALKHLRGCYRHIALVTAMLISKFLL